MAHLPSGDFMANSGWLVLAAMAFNLMRSAEPPLWEDRWWQQPAEQHSFRPGFLMKGNRPWVGPCARRLPVVAAYVAMLVPFNEQIRQLGEMVEENFGQHPAAEIYLSQPGLGIMLLVSLGSSAMTRPGSSAHVLGRTTPDRARSPAPLGERPWYWHGLPLTGASAMPSTSRPILRSTAHPALGPTTTPFALAASATTQRCVNWSTDWSGSNTAASRPAPSTTKTPPGSIKTGHPNHRGLTPFVMGCLTRAVGVAAGGQHGKAVTATIRARLIFVAGRITRSARPSTLRLPTNWPWANEFQKLTTAGIGSPTTNTPHQRPTRPEELPDKPGPAGQTSHAPDSENAPTRPRSGHKIN